MRGSFLKMGRLCLEDSCGGGEMVDEPAVALQRIHIDPRGS
jgi:hypothetical protein